MPPARAGVVHSETTSTDTPESAARPCGSRPVDGKATTLENVCHPPVRESFELSLFYGEKDAVLPPARVLRSPRSRP
ncbi:hypothetical protein AB0C59_16365 [Streptomyces sp. NPDC048664]|uniref:hypothetical protein n=1 Tax=Streptomyces sp. NPDC048664 TaxID=3154505 RepID=UPI0034390FAD